MHPKHDIFACVAYLDDLNYWSEIWNNSDFINLFIFNLRCFFCSPKKYSKKSKIVKYDYNLK